MTVQSKSFGFPPLSQRFPTTHLVIRMNARAHSRPQKKKVDDASRSGAEAAVARGQAEGWGGGAKDAAI